jgi:hypothetical protein
VPKAPDFCHSFNLAQHMQSSEHEPNGFKTYSQEDNPMTTFAQRITAAATAFALSLALIAGTVHTQTPNSAPAAVQEMI